MSQTAIVQQTHTGVRPQLRLLSYNIQAGMATTRPHHYLTQSWKHVLPHARSLGNLDKIAHLISDFDIVALQEVDAGSLRSGFVNQAEYLAARGHFPYWNCQTNRNLGQFGQHSNVLLSRYRPSAVSEQKLPGFIPGRGVMTARYGSPGEELIVFHVHLALGKRARLLQLEYISGLVNEHEHVVLMGDLNCQLHSREMDILFKRTHLREPEYKIKTFPSWRPQRNLDHILVTPSLEISNPRVLPSSLSDHLPISVEVSLPEVMSLDFC
ncbi:MAG: endonuclease/exonuclease/phosphatase family protein [Gammaproteobacteria bacterium]